MSDDDTLTIDFDDENSPFSKCPDCGHVHVSKKAHTCPLNESRDIPVGDSSASRRRRAEADTRDPDGLVVISDRRRTARAYHRPTDPTGEADAERADRCRAYPKAETGWMYVTRADAKFRGMYPCGFCFGIDADGTTWEGADE